MVVAPCDGADAISTEAAVPPERLGVTALAEELAATVMATSPATGAARVAAGVTLVDDAELLLVPALLVAVTVKL